MTLFKSFKISIILIPLSFELCSNIEANITTHIDSVKNPISGHIHAKGIDELIIDDNMVDRTKTVIEVDE